MNPFDLRGAKIFPRVVHHRYVEYSAERVAELGQSAEGQGLVAMPWKGELMISYAFDLGHSYVLMNDAHLQELGRTRDQVHEEAIRNLQESLGRLKVLVKMGVKRLVAPDDLEAAAVLDASLWDYLRREEGADLLVMVPHKSSVFFIAETKKNARRKLLDAAKDAPKDNHSLTNQMFRYTESGFVADAQ